MTHKHWIGLLGLWMVVLPSGCGTFKDPGTFAESDTTNQPDVDAVLDIATDVLPDTEPDADVADVDGNIDMDPDVIVGCGDNRCDEGELSYCCSDCQADCEGLGFTCLEARDRCDCPVGRTACESGCVDFEVGVEDPDINQITHCGGCRTLDTGLKVQRHTCLPQETCANGQCSCEGPNGPEPRCAPGTSCCPGLGCVDQDRTPGACGECGNVCNPGERCRGGECDCGNGEACGAGESCCNDQCVPANDPICNCGGSPCQGATTCCNATCLDTLTDDNNCGVCGNVCGTGEHCELGACVCDDGLGACGTGSCSVDLTSNPTHCGACFNTCGDGEDCVDGSCNCPNADPNRACDANETCCSTGCVNTEIDDANCGECHGEGNPPRDATCAGGTVCQGGGCSCNDGQGSLCDGVCTDLDNDANHCSSCDTDCESHLNVAVAACTNGNCLYTCNSGHGDCSPVSGCETDLSRDHDNCGSCGNSCESLEECIDSQCSFGNWRTVRTEIVDALQVQTHTGSLVFQGGGTGYTNTVLDMNGMSSIHGGTFDIDATTRQVTMFNGSETLVGQMVQGGHLMALYDPLNMVQMLLVKEVRSHSEPDLFGKWDLFGFDARPTTLPTREAYRFVLQFDTAGALVETGSTWVRFNDQNRFNVSMQAGESPTVNLSGATHLKLDIESEGSVHLKGWLGPNSRVMIGTIAISQRPQPGHFIAIRRSSGGDTSNIAGDYAFVGLRNGPDPSLRHGEIVAQNNGTFTASGLTGVSNPPTFTSGTHAVHSNGRSAGTMGSEAFNGSMARYGYSKAQLVINGQSYNPEYLSSPRVGAVEVWIKKP